MVRTAGIVTGLLLLFGGLLGGSTQSLNGWALMLALLGLLLASVSYSRDRGATSGGPNPPSGTAGPYGEHSSGDGSPGDGGGGGGA